MRQRGRRRNCSLARSFQSWQESMLRGHMEIYTHHRESGLGKTSVQRRCMKWKDGIIAPSEQGASRKARRKERHQCQLILLSNLLCTGTNPVLTKPSSFSLWVRCTLDSLLEVVHGVSMSHDLPLHFPCHMQCVNPHLSQACFPAKLKATFIVTMLNMANA